MAIPLDKAETKLPVDLTDFEKIKEQLAIQFYPNTLDHKAFIHHEDIPGITTEIVIDSTEEIGWIFSKYRETWGITFDALFEIAKNNTFNRYKIDITPHKIKYDLEVLELYGGHDFAATFILQIENFPQLIGKFGSFVLIPHQFASVAFPINDDLAEKALYELPYLASSMFEEKEKNPITPNLYWYYKGEFNKIAYDLDASIEKLYIAPHPELMDILGALSDRERTTLPFLDLTGKQKKKIFFWPEISIEIEGEQKKLIYVDEEVQYAGWAGRVLPGQTIEEGIATELADFLHYKGRFEYDVVGFRDTAFDNKGRAIERYTIDITLLDPLSSLKTKNGWDIVFE